MNTAVQDNTNNNKNKKNGNWLILMGFILAAGLIAGFYGINKYFSLTDIEIETARSDSKNFETVFRDTSNSRMESLSLALESLLTDKEMVSLFAKREREKLFAHVEPYFKDVLLKNYGINQLNFSTPPATEYLRVQDPKAFGADLSKIRQTIVAAVQRRQLVSAPETGLGGVIGLRAVAPILDEKSNVIGTVGLSDPFTNSLERARQTLQIDWALGLNKERAEAVDRPTNNKVDVYQGDDVFFQFSRPEISAMLRPLEFNARKGQIPLLQKDGKTIFVQGFTVNNFAGKPTIVVATVRDLTAVFEKIKNQVIIHSLVAFVLFAVIGCGAFLRFRTIREGFMNAINRQKLELDEKSAFCEAAVIRLRDVEVIKRGFFASVVEAVTNPLRTLAGQMSSILSQLKNSDQVKDDEVIKRIEFVVEDVRRLSRLVDDYHHIEMFRQKFFKGDIPKSNVGQAIKRAIDDELTYAERLPQLFFENSVGNDLPLVRAQPDLLAKAFVGLIGYAVEGGGQGFIALDAEVETTGWIKLRIAGSAFDKAGAPNDALIDESRQFLNKINSSDNSGMDQHAYIVAVALSRVIIEFYGGSLETLSANSTHSGFIVRLPISL